ncbi:MAG: hypothetical protein AAF628_36970 [Planctomycetota bacterium]
MELRLVPGLPEPVATRPAVDVRLIREFKGPTVGDLLAAEPNALDLLPGVVRTMQDSVEAGDLAEAERRLGTALGLVLPGPGERRRRVRRVLRWGLAGALLAAAAVLTVLTARLFA